MIAPKVAALAAVVAYVSISLAATWTRPAPVAAGLLAAPPAPIPPNPAATSFIQPVNLVQGRLTTPPGVPNADAGQGTGADASGGGSANTSSANISSNTSARGLARAVREATLSTRMASRIMELPLADGMSFKAGALLVKFDCDRQTAEARAASAAADAQKKMVDTNEELDKFESIGKNDLAISRSQLDKARAEAEALKSQLKDCSLYAPFGGRVVERLVHNFEAVAANQPLLKVVDTSELEIELIVPSAWLQWLAEGASFQFRIDETGQTVAGHVARLTPTVDPVSKTTKVIGRLLPGKGVSQVLPGMSGSAQFSRFAPSARKPVAAKPASAKSTPSRPAKLATNQAKRGNTKAPVATAKRQGPAAARG